MANKYLYSGAAGAATGADWANAYTTLAVALAGLAAGDDLWVAHDHAETTAAAITLTSPGTFAAPCRIFCVNRGGSVPPVSADLATTATVATTGSNSHMTFAGASYYYGITFNVADGANRGDFRVQTILFAILESCNIVLNNTNTASVITVGSNGSNGGQVIQFVNTTVKFGSVSQSVSQASGGGRFVWTKTVSAISGAGSVPTSLITFSSTRGASCSMIGVDVSALGSGKNIVSWADSSNSVIRLEGCKLGASVTPLTGTTSPGLQFWMINSDSADTNYRYHKQTYQGTITQETTIVRTGGATDGTTPISRKMVSTANTKFYAPLESDPIAFWNETVGSSITVTVPVITDNVTLTDREAWVEVEYLGTSGFPLSLKASDAAADPLAVAANQATDSSSTWTTTGLTTPVKQSLSISFTPQEKGLVRARVMLAKASTTMYYDPLILASSARQHMIGEGGHMNQDAAAASGGLLIHGGMQGGMRG